MLHIEVLGTEFPGENEDGAAILVDQLRRAVDKRFPGTSQPKILFVDRGRKFYEKNHGKITPKFKEALTRNRFKAYYGDNAKAQPGAMHELMLHGTAVSWIRYLEEQTRPREPWTESVSEYASRMEGIAVDKSTTCAELFPRGCRSCLRQRATASASSLRTIIQRQLLN